MPFKLLEEGGNGSNSNRNDVLNAQNRTAEEPSTTAMIIMTYSLLTALAHR
jgi:hypothetical protein